MPTTSTASPRTYPYRPLESIRPDDVVGFQGLRFRVVRNDVDAGELDLGTPDGFEPAHVGVHIYNRRTMRVYSRAANCRWVHPRDLAPGDIVVRTGHHVQVVENPWPDPLIVRNIETSTLSQYEPRGERVRAEVSW